MVAEGSYTKEKMYMIGKIQAIQATCLEGERGGGQYMLDIKESDELFRQKMVTRYTVMLAQIW